MHSQHTTPITTDTPTDREPSSPSLNHNDRTSTNRTPPQTSHTVPVQKPSSLPTPPAPTATPHPASPQAAAHSTTNPSDAVSASTAARAATQPSPQAPTSRVTSGQSTPAASGPRHASSADTGCVLPSEMYTSDTLIGSTVCDVFELWLALVVGWKLPRKVKRWVNSAAYFCLSFYMFRFSEVKGMDWWVMGVLKTGPSKAHSFHVMLACTSIHTSNHEGSERKKVINK